jgi:hypothetical protein
MQRNWYFALRYRNRYEVFCLNAINIPFRSRANWNSEYIACCIQVANATKKKLLENIHAAVCLYYHQIISQWARCMIFEV